MEVGGPAPSGNPFDGAFTAPAAVIGAASGAQDDVQLAAPEAPVFGGGLRFDDESSDGAGRAEGPGFAADGAVAGRHARAASESLSSEGGEGAPAGERREPLRLANPDDLPEQLPPGKVKLLAFVLVFFLWVGGWGALDQVVEVLSHDNKLVSMLLYTLIAGCGGIGLKIIARRYRGYALLDEIREMEEATVQQH